MYRLKMDPEPETIKDPDLRAKNILVRYNIPGLGFGCETRVTYETAQLLRIAFEAGKEKAKAEIREMLGVGNG